MIIRTLIAGAVALASSITAPLFAKVPDADLEKMKEAAPEAAPIKVDTPRKILVFSRTTGFRHRSIPHGIEALRIMGEKSGAYTIVATEDPAVFTAENLKQFDAICMLNTTGKPIPSDEGKAAFEAFVKGGGGLIGIHSATDTHYDWAEYGKMIGGYFAGHPWNAGSMVTVKVEDQSHALNEAFGEITFQVKDEIYQFREDENYDRSRLRVLLSLDLSAEGMERRGMKRKDNDYPVGWIQEYGNGRVFYNTLGHNESTYWNPTVLRHFLAGIQYACGDLKADATPSAKAKVGE